MAGKTKYEGLWGNETRPGWYISKVFYKNNLPAKFKIILRYNKFYEKDGDKPRFIFSICESETAKAMAFENDEYEDLREMRCFDDDTLQQLINRVACDVGGEGMYGEYLVEDYVSGYGMETELY